MGKTRYIRGDVPGARLYWIDTRKACGGIFVRSGRIVGGAGSFSRLAGLKVKDLPKRYTVKKV
jgi:hypothetical protein